jgi:carbamoyltransferase
MNNVLSFYGSHDCSAVYVNKNGNVKILEYERFIKKRYAMYSDRFDYRNGIGSSQNERLQFLNYICNDIGNTDRITKIVYNELSNTDIALLQNFFKKAIFEIKGHHIAHAASGYYMSGFEEALIFSVDGGGVDHGEVGFTHVYHAKGKKITHLENVKYDFGGAYSYIAWPISEIRPGADDDIHSLAYAGKVMGLCAYGKVVPEWVNSMNTFYRTHDLHQLGRSIGLNIGFNTLSGSDSYNLAATSQYIFETGMLDLIIPYLKQYKTNIVLVGGCALNVLFNQKFFEFIKERFPEISLYIPPFPNDCGLGVGQFLLENPDALKNTTVTYNGFDILDQNELPKYVSKYNAEKVGVDRIASLILQGNIIGVMQGGSEVGPRALGNRSIICYPGIPGMKDTLNSKVKFREWYRPFAPVCRLEDKDIYFEHAPEAIYMSYAPKVKEQYHKDLSSITHVDNTSRLQTVTREQHALFYDIITEIAKTSDKPPVILNTSFNIKGRPILTTISDAIYVLDNTKLDYLWIEGWLFKKK